MGRCDDHESPAREGDRKEERLLRDSARSVREEHDRPAPAEHGSIAKLAAHRCPGARLGRIPDDGGERTRLAGRAGRPGLMVVVPTANGPGPVTSGWASASVGAKSARTISQQGARIPRHKA